MGLANLLRSSGQDIDAQQVFNVKDMYASILVTGALGYVLNLAFLLAEKRLIHWSGKA